MTIAVNQTIPNVEVFVAKDGMPQATETKDLFAGKKVVLFAVPGAFTPTCSNAHLPGFVVLADKIKAKGVDSILCMSVNDAFVMDAWGQSKNAEELIMLGDGNGRFTEALGLDFDGSGFGLGQRCQRFALVAEDGKVVHLAVEDGPELKKSSAEAILEVL